MMAPEFAKAAQLLKGRTRFGKLDMDAFQEAGARYRVRGIPLIVMFCGGREIGRRTGAMSPRDISDWIVAEIAASQSEDAAR